MSPASRDRIHIASPAAPEALKAHLRVNQQIPDGLGGTPINILVDEFLSRGFPVVVYTLSAQVHEPVMLEGDRLRVHVGPYRARPRDRALDFFHAERRFLEQAIRTEAPAFVHAHWSYEFALAALAAAPKALVTAHDAPLNILRAQPDTYRIIRTGMAYRALRKATYVTAVSPHVAGHLRKYRFVRAGCNIDCIPNGLPGACFEDRGRDSGTGTTRFATILNGWTKLKNATSALQAFSMLRKAHSESTLLMFGEDYGISGKAESWARANELHHGVQFRGRTAYEPLMDALRDEVDILVHPSREESQGMVLIEAMARGIPVIGGGQAGAVPWTLDEGRAGVLVDVDDPASIASAMERLARDSASRRSVGKAGFDSARSRFGIGAVADRYLDVYERVSRHE